MFEETRWELDPEPSDNGTLAILEGDDEQSVIALVSPAVGDHSDKRYPSFAYARLMTGAPALYRAAERVMAELNRRIDVASASGEAVPLFDGIAELSDAINAIKHRSATATPGLSTDTDRKAD